MAINFELSEENKMFVRAVREMLETYVPRREELTKMMMKDKKFPEEMWQDFAQLGLTGCLIPEEYGGNGAGLLPLVMAFEEITAFGFSPGLLLLTAMDSCTILKNGSEEMKKRIFPPIVEGKKKLAWALTEPNAGSNAFNIETMARKDGDHYVLNGQKTFITGVDLADEMLVVARTMSVSEVKDQGMPKMYGISLFLVDTKAEGLKKQLLPTRGIEGMNQFQLFFDDVKVSAENLIGEEHVGTMALFNSLNPERVLAGSIAAGMIRFCLERAVDYAKERKVFGGRPIGSYQALSHPLAQTRIDLELLQMINYKAAWAFDQGYEPAEVGKYCNMSKYFGAEAGLKAVDRAIQTHGGYGFSEEYGIIYLWEGVRLLKTAPISNEMILNFISEHVLNLPRSY